MRVIEKLLVVQDLDCRIREFEQALKDIPAREQLEVGRLEEHRLAVKRAEGLIKSAQADVHRSELEIESLRAKVLKLRQQQGGLKTNKEFTAMGHEIAAAEDEIAAAEERELTLMEQVEKARGELAGQASDLKIEEEAVRKDVAALKERAAELQRDLGRVQAERVLAVADIDAHWLQHYERVFHHRKDKALVPVEGGICGGCHMKVTPTVQHASRKQEAMVVCEMCGRLLYS